MRTLIVRILSWFILSSKERKKFRIKLNTWFLNRKLYKFAKIGKGFRSPQTHCTVNKNMTIGDYVTYNGVLVAGEGKVTVGSYCHFGSDILILTTNHDYESTKIPFDDSSIEKEITIEDFVWIGSRVTILPGTKIGEGAIIQAGAVVHGEIPPCAIAGGNPAKVFKYRDIEHFNKLKSEGEFYMP